MKNYQKIIAGVVAAALSAGATGTIAYAKNKDNTPKETEAASPAAVSEAASDRPSRGDKAYKDETVYVLCGKDSSVKNVIVSDWLKNTPALSSISDVSSLSSIINVKGDETFTINGEELSWSANGSDIYYRGNSDKELPVEVTMKYFLDGNEVDPASIVGKSGHIVIRWEYKNNQKVTRNIGGKDKEMYVPFMAASAALLNNEKFLNAEITSGKVISDGNRLIVVGLAFPGLSESLGLDQIEDLNFTLPDYVEFSADVTDFEIGTSVTAVSNEIFSNLSTDGDFKLGDLKEQLNELTEGANKLCDGTAALYDGINTLSEKSGELTGGIDKLSAGAESLKNGASDLSDGAKALAGGAKTVSDSTAELNSGIKSAKNGSKSMTDGIAKLSKGAGDLSSGLSSAKSGSDELASGVAQISGSTGKLKTGADAVTKGAQDLSAGMETAGSSLNTTIAANEQALAALQAAYAKSPTQDMATVIATLQQTIAAQKQIAASMTTGGTLKIGAEQLASGSQTISGSIDALNAGINKLSTGANDLSSGLGKLSTGAVDLNSGLSQLSTGAVSLDEGLSQLLTGSTKLSEGTLKLYQSAEALSTGGSKLSGGASELWEGTNSLKDGSKALVEGITQLKDGSKDVRDGMKKFNDEGISAIAGVVNDKLPSIIENFKALQNVSREYNSYSGISDDMNGCVKFLYFFDGTK